MMNEDYPGVTFTPPQGTIPMGENMGQGMVEWEKIDGRYTMTSFEGKPISASAKAQEEAPESDVEIDEIAKQMPEE